MSKRTTNSTDVGDELRKRQAKEGLKNNTTSSLSMCRRCKKNAQVGNSAYCLQHKCSVPECDRGVESRKLCKAHGGGKRCQWIPCDKAAQGGFNFCANHGGQMKCSMAGCEQGRRDRTPFCIRHGGGNRCTFAGCLNSQAGNKLCRRHGGGSRCTFVSEHGIQCQHSASTTGNSHLCVTHGGGKRCSEEGCRNVVYSKESKCRRHTESNSVLCQIDGCGRGATKAGYCGKHFERPVCSVASCHEIQTKRSGFCKNHFEQHLVLRDEPESLLDQLAKRDVIKSVQTGEDERNNQAL